ncbi:MAG TPA: flagellar biosynthetic protein FliR [Acidobacteriota bacterium]|nr:flagellar biosynthetic protein FliR [Acidobacteriota bacterium]
MEPLLFSLPEIIRFVIVLLRVSGIMLFAPFFSNQAVPLPIRAALALVVAYVLTPSLPLNTIPSSLDLSSITGVAAGEILSGVLLGFVASCVFAGMQFAGQVISFQLGFSLINQFDPQTNVEAPVFSFLQNYVGLLFFLLINGHHWFLLAISDSFGPLPVGGFRIHGSVVTWLLELTAQVFVIGLRIAGPVIIVTTIVDVVLGIIGRAAPQIQIIIVGMPVKILAGLGCLSFCFYFLPRYLDGVFSTLHKTLFSLVHTMS